MRFYNMLDANQKVEISMKESWFDSVDLDEKENHLKEVSGFNKDRH